MTYLTIMLVLALTATLCWAPRFRRAALGDPTPALGRHFHALNGFVLIATLFWCYIAIRTGARLDYTQYLIQWDMVLSGEVMPWGEHSRNAYGPLYNLLAPLIRLDAYLPKCLFVFAWAWSSVFLVGQSYRRSGQPLDAWMMAFVMLVSPFFAVLIAHYGFFDILPAGLILMAVHLRTKDRDGWAGAALAAAVLLKYYPLAVLPFLMLDGRKLRLKLLISCLGLIGLGMLASFAWWGDSTLHPLMFASDRESKWLSVFRVLRGPYSPLKLFMEDPNADALSVPAMILFGGGLWLWCWLRRVPVVPACIAGLAIGLQFYKVGHVQFQMSVILLIGYAFATGQLLSSRHRAALISGLAYLGWLTVFVLVYAILRRVSREGLLLSIRDFSGWIGLAMTLWLVAGNLSPYRFSRRKPVPVTPGENS